MPISYEDAEAVSAGAGRTGGAGGMARRAADHIQAGPSLAKAHLELKFNWDRKPLYDVIARIPGSTYPDQWVIRGNHHDAWVNGADDPVSRRQPGAGRGARHWASC